jgi:chromate reductase
MVPTVSKPLDVVAIVGSLRAESLTRRVVLALAAMTRDALTIEIVDISVLPLYNQDIDTTPPAAWTALDLASNALRPFSSRRLSTTGPFPAL